MPIVFYWSCLEESPPKHKISKLQNLWGGSCKSIERAKVVDIKSKWNEMENHKSNVFKRYGYQNIEWNFVEFTKYIFDLNTNKLNDCIVLLNLQMHFCKYLHLKIMALKTPHKIGTYENHFCSSTVYIFYRNAIPLPKVYRLCHKGN